MNTRFKENVQKLFEFWCEISPTAIGEKVSGVIVERFPLNFKDPEIITKIPEFAYPCQFLNESVQTYSFVLTSTDSKWRFGFCRHDAKTRTAMVIITYLPWHDTFLRFLNVLGELRRTSLHEFHPFLSEAYAKGVPEPGACLKLFYNSGLNNFIFQRPSQFQLPSIPENHNLNLYYNFVDPKNMIAVFAAMLAERRIVFTSQRLDRLSSCVQAANSFLYPMVWQHIFIPILPLKMKEILCAPMPYLIGVPEAVLETMTREELGEVVILNCDNKYLETPFDDVKNMPAELVSQLKKQLTNQNDHIGDRVSKIFLGILVQLIGGYRDAIKFSQGEKITWCRETFIDSRPSHLRPFLRDMLELQIFQQFIEERLEMLNTGLGFSDEFELETLRHLEKSSRRGKNFLRNVKEKTNPAVKSAVQSVKQGGRGVKTAYKDLKSKLQDRAPPKATTRSTLTASAVASVSSISGGGSGSIGYQHHHHSAPNSPVFTKRPHSDLISISNSSTHRSKPQTAMLQTSNSMMNNSNMSNHMNNNNHNNINNNNSNNLSHAVSAAVVATGTTASSSSSSSSNIACNNNGKNSNSHTNSKSPITVSSSPTSSQSSSSEMNILQELQQHALFKLPTVDRSLKPVNSLEHTRRSSRSGSLVSTPEHHTNAKQPPHVPVAMLFLLDDSVEQSNSNRSSPDFDTPPDTLPPVPPRITNPPPTKARNKHRIAAAAIEQLVIIDTDVEPSDDLPASPPPIPTARTKAKAMSSMSNSSLIRESPAHIKMSFENNFVQNTSNSLFSVAKSSNVTTAIRATPPLIKPLPTLSMSESTTNGTPPSEDSLDTSANLIQLDSSTSFELDDFDPLNQNAKEIPTVMKKPPLPSSILPQIISTPSAAMASSSHSRVQAFSNPVYPYHVPEQSQLLSSSSTSLTKSDDDVELLRKYGLDRFKLVDTNRKTYNTNAVPDLKSNIFMGKGNGNSTHIGSSHNLKRTTDDNFVANGNGSTHLPLNTTTNHIKTNGSGYIQQNQHKKNSPWTTFD